jgi:hypothetical protein
VVTNLVQWPLVQCMARHAWRILLVAVLLASALSNGVVPSTRATASAQLLHPQRVAAPLARQVSALQAQAQTATSAGYTTTLTSPVPPAGATIFAWRISGSKPGPGLEISNATFSGCWTAAQVKSARASATGGTPPVEINSSTGAAKIDSLSDNTLPLTLTVTYMANCGSLFE